MPAFYFLKNRVLKMQSANDKGDVATLITIDHASGLVTYEVNGVRLVGNYRDYVREYNRLLATTNDQKRQ